MAFSAAVYTVAVLLPVVVLGVLVVVLNARRQHNSALPVGVRRGWYWPRNNDERKPFEIVDGDEFTGIRSGGRTTKSRCILLMFHISQIPGTVL